MTTITTWSNRGTAPAAAAPHGTSATAAVTQPAAAITARTRPIVRLIMGVSRAVSRLGPGKQDHGDSVRANEVTPGRNGGKYREPSAQATHRGHPARAAVACWWR